MPADRQRADATPPPPRVIVTTSWDDGHIYDFAVANLLEQYSLAGTFYIAPRNQELPERARLRDRDIGELGARFEIGGHTLTHQRITQVPNDTAREEIVNGKRYLEDCLGRDITSFCYPGGAYRPDQTHLVEDAGFRLARTIERHRIDLGHSPMEVPTTFHAYQHLLDGPAAARMGRRPMRASRWFFQWDRWAIAWFDRVLEHGGVYHLWGHSWELERRDDWPRLERVLDYISGRDEVAYVDNASLIPRPQGARHG